MKAEISVKIGSKGMKTKFEFEDYKILERYVYRLCKALSTVQGEKYTKMKFLDDRIKKEVFKDETEHELE